MTDPARTGGGRALPALAIFYPAWVAYGSLFPLVGWRDDGLPPLGFMFAGWPRYWTAFDIGANVLLYLPLGYLWFCLLRRRLAAAAALAIAVGLAAAFSLTVEIVQGWLPSRVSSNLDFLCNAAGALAGAILATRFHPVWSDRFGALWRTVERPTGELQAGIALLAVWVLLQLSPESVLFTSGPGGYGLSSRQGAVEAATRLHLESAAVGLHAIAVALVAAHLMSGTRPQIMGRLLLGALAVVFAKAVVTAFAIGFGRSFDWLSAGAQWGVLGGILLTPAALLLPARVRIALALAGLVGGTAALAVLPASPYVASPSIGLLDSPVRNFVGATEWMTRAWPALAIAYLTWRLLAPTMSPLTSRPEN